MIMFDLHGKRALVTGSTQGIGYAIAKTLIAAGAAVTVHCSSDLGKAERIARQLGAADAVVADLSCPEEVEALPTKTGEIDILVLNASVQCRRPWTEIPREEAERQMQVNFHASLRLMQCYAPAMERAGWGRIVTVGSVQQTKPHREMPVYAATKCAVMSLVRNLASQLAPSGVTVNNLSPGVIATPRNDAALSQPAYREQVLARIPVGYAGEAEDCAAAALLLCSPEGRYITGIDLPVDGGMSL